MPLTSCAKRYVTHDTQHFKYSVNCSNIPLVELVSICGYHKDGQNHIIDHSQTYPPYHHLVVSLVILMINSQVCNWDFPYLTNRVPISSTIILQTFAYHISTVVPAQKLYLHYLFHFDQFSNELVASDEFGQFQLDTYDPTHRCSSSTEKRKMPWYFWIKSFNDPHYPQFLKTVSITSPIDCIVHLKTMRWSP